MRGSVGRCRKPQRQAWSEGGVNHKQLFLQWARQFRTAGWSQYTQKTTHCNTWSLWAISYTKHRSNPSDLGSHCSSSTLQEAGLFFKTDFLHSNTDFSGGEWWWGAEHESHIGGSFRWHFPSPASTFAEAGFDPYSGDTRILDWKETKSCWTSLFKGSIERSPTTTNYKADILNPVKSNELTCRYPLPVPDVQKCSIWRTAAFHYNAS